MSSSIQQFTEDWHSWRPVRKSTPMSLEELEERVYGFSPSTFSLRKADAPVLTSTTGVRNVLFGATAWTQVDKNVVPLNMVPKKSWDYSNYRAETAQSATSSPGQAENITSLPDTVKPTIAEVQSVPRLNFHGIERSAIMAAVQNYNSEDDWAWSDQQAKAVDTFNNRMARALMTNVTTTAGNNLESFDRIASSYAEVNNCGDVNANDADLAPHLVNGSTHDRDGGATWADADVQHNSNTDRNLTLSLIDDNFANIDPYRKLEGNQVLVTGLDTLHRIEQLIYPQTRFEGGMGVTMTYNGIQTHKGGEGMFQVASYRDKPILWTTLAVQDTISRIYNFDFNHLWMSVAQPTVWGELAPNVGNFFAIDRTAGLAGVYNVMNLTCNLFRAQGKVRDLQ